MKLAFKATIKVKLITMGLVAVVAVGLMAAISWDAGKVVRHKTRENQVMLEQAQQLSDLRVGSIELVLAAMDSIVDAKEGYVYDERLEIMDRSIEALRNSQELIQAVAPLGCPKQALFPAIGSVASSAAADLMTAELILSVQH